jgi:tetratricopeptide (TPR) repeat protein
MMPHPLSHVDRVRAAHALLILLMFCSGAGGMLEARAHNEQGRETTAPASPEQIRLEDLAAAYQSGVAALTQGKPREALRYFERVHASRPTDTPPLMRMLQCQLELKQSQAARRSVQKLKVLLKPQNPLLFEMASLLARHGDYGTAIPIMEKVRSAFPESYDVNYNLALAYFLVRQYGKSVEVIQSLIKDNPRAEAYNLLATIEEERRNYLEAVRCYQKAAELEPANEGYRFDYGFELLKHQTLPAAIAVFTSGVRDFPGALRMQLGLGCAYYLDRKSDDAAAALLSALTIQPKTPFAYLLLGKIYEAADSSQTQIEKALQSYLENEPRDAWAYYHYARIRQRSVDAEPQPDYQPIRKYLNRALALNPGFAEAHVQMGIVLKREGRFKESLPHLEKAVQSDPGLDVAHFQLGQTYQRLGMEDKALKEFEIFEELKARSQTDKDKEVVMQFLVEQKR